jgi:hypothetical protein
MLMEGVFYGLAPVMLADGGFGPKTTIVDGYVAACHLLN